VTAGFLQPCRFDNFQFCRNKVQYFGDIFAYKTQGTATGRTGLTRVENNTLPWCRVRNLWFATLPWGRECIIADIMLPDIIPTVDCYNPLAHLRSPIDMMRHG
jgi:hypothetical protein